MVFIFDECHRSQFGENHQAIKAFLPELPTLWFYWHTNLRRQCDRQADQGGNCHYANHERSVPARTPRLHNYSRDRGPATFSASTSITISPRDALDSDNSVRRLPSRRLSRPFLISMIRCKRRPAFQRTIGDRVDQRCHRVCCNVFKMVQAKRQVAEPKFVPLKIAAVFSPPAEGNKDVQQIQEDLPQEKEGQPERAREGKKTSAQEPSSSRL